MRDLTSAARCGVAATFLGLTAMLPVDTMAATSTTPPPDDQNQTSNEITIFPAPAKADTPPAVTSGTVVTVPPFAPLFATPEDARAFWNMSARAYASPVPDARTIARAFIHERLGIDGDVYVVAHFATTQFRAEGSGDNAITLTDALMKAFPDHSRHTFFAVLADAVGGVNAGGASSPAALPFVESLLACRQAGECFSRVGRFLWSRTGPGYLYNTFFARDNVIDTVGEDLRPLDEAFGIYPKTSTFLPEHASPLLLSQVIGKLKDEGVFAELPYIKRLKATFDTYWETNKPDWPLLARYRFVHQARRARETGVLTQAQYEQVMQGGAANAPLAGAITLQHLRNTPPAGAIQVRRFDINGYAASDILRFVATDGSEVIYIPGAASPFVAFRGESELRLWVIEQARHPLSLDALLSHFSIYNRQDGVFWTGVGQGLVRLVNGQWTPDNTAIDRGTTLITGDVFEDMQVQTEARLRDDAWMRTSTAWDAWRTTLSRTAAVLGPIGYAPPLAIPVQTGSTLIGLVAEIDQGIHGKTAEDRKQALKQAVMTVVTSTVFGAALGGVGSSEEAVLAEQTPPHDTSTRSTSVASSASPQRVSGRVGHTVGTIASPTAQAASVHSESGTRPPVHVDNNGIPSPLPSEWENQLHRVFDPLPDYSAIEFNPRFRDVGPGRQELGYLVQTLPNNSEEWGRAIIQMKKSAIDERRRSLDDVRDDALAINPLGYQISLDHSIVYRVDVRTPRQLLADGGFGPSEEFSDIEPMLRQRSTIGSGSLWSSNQAFQDWQAGFPGTQPFHQYAVWTDGRVVASASDNHEPRQYEVSLDEVHFPADISANDIYIIDSSNPFFAGAIARIYESRHVSTPYGIPLEAFNEFLAGRLDIDTPNRFTPERLTASFQSQGSPSNESGNESASTLSIRHQPLSSSDTSASGSLAPLIRP